MGHSVLSWVCICALGVVPLVACSETASMGGSGGSGGMGGVCDGSDGMCNYTPVADGTACDQGNDCSAGTCADGTCDSTPVADGTACGNNAGTCQQGRCRMACAEQGIRDAIATGGGPYTFGCDGSQTVVTEAEIVIDNDVILDGEGNLTLDGQKAHFLFVVQSGVTAALRRMRLTRGGCLVGKICGGGGIKNFGALTLNEVELRENTGKSYADAALMNEGTMIVEDSTVWNNDAAAILNAGGDACLDANGEPLTTDQRGEPRPAGAGSMCDVGSFEVHP